MSKTVTLEELPAEAQTETTAALTPEEAADIKAAIAQGEADYATGRCLTLDEFKAKYADKLREDAE